MTSDEIRAESFKTIQHILNEVFPGILCRQDGNIIEFEDGAIKVEIDGNDNREGYFNITNDTFRCGSYWGVKPTLSVIIQEICKIRKQKALKNLH
jgi:hypothetical protein